MVVKVLSVLDLLTVLFFILAKFGVVSTITWVFLAYLLLKSLIFITSWVSAIDLVCVIFFFLAIYGYWYFLSWLAIVWIIQKAALSFIS